jgi:hypothetical protein
MKKFLFSAEEIEDGKVKVSFESEGFSNYEIVGFLENQKLDLLMDIKELNVIEEGETK